MKQLTYFPVSVGNVKFHAKASLLTFTAVVNQDGDIENGVKKSSFTSGVVYGNAILLGFVRKDSSNFECKR